MPWEAGQHAALPAQTAPWSCGTCSCCSQSQQLRQLRTRPAARHQASRQICFAPAGTDATSMHRSAQIKSPQRHGPAQEVPASPVPATAQAPVQPHPSPLVSGLPPPSPLRMRGARAAEVSAQPGTPAEEAAADRAMQAIAGVVDIQCSSPMVAGQFDQPACPVAGCSCGCLQKPPCGS